jgi:hypothetical protein
MAALPKPTPTRREDPSRGDRRTRVRASAGSPQAEPCVGEAPTGPAGNDEMRLIPDDSGAVDGALLVRGSAAEAVPDHAAGQVLLALATQVSAFPAPHLAPGTRGAR